MKNCLVAFSFTAIAVSQLLTPPFVSVPDQVEYRSREVTEFLGGDLVFESDTKLCDPNVKQYTGYFSIRGTNKKYFFWFFEARQNPASAPTVAWLTGGPGCSSMLALFGENGPCTVNKDGKSTSLNKYSWSNNANMFWIDQPPGTGFSEGDADSGEEEVANDMLGFLIALFDALPQYNRDFYVFGESYAGHYIPAITHKIFTYNQGRNPCPRIDLKGMGIGNGLTNPSEQYKWYPTMAYNSTTAPQIVTEEEFKDMQDSVEMCTNLIDLCNNFDGQNPTCFASMIYCNMKLMKPYQDHGMNPYDMRQKCEKPPLCYDFSEIDKYLNDPEIKKVLKADPSVTWEQCNFQVNMQFMFDFMRNYHTLIPPVLESGNIRVLIYVGDQDYICNWIGNKEWVLNMEWTGKDKFNAEQDKLYITGDGGEVGKIRSYGGLTFLQVFEAGHMVPMDQPEKSLFMFEQFIGGKMGVENAGFEEAQEPIEYLEA